MKKALWKIVIASLGAACGSAVSLLWLDLPDAMACWLAVTTACSIVEIVRIPITKKSKDDAQ